MKTSKLIITTLVVVIGLGAIYIWMQDDDAGTAEHTNAAMGEDGYDAGQDDAASNEARATTVYKFCTGYGMSDSYCICNAEQAQLVFADHDWQAIRIMDEDGVEAMQIHMTENYDIAEWEAFVLRMNRLDTMTAANCPPA